MIAIDEAFRVIINRLLPSAAAKIVVARDWHSQGIAGRQIKALLIGAKDIKEADKFVFAVGGLKINTLGFFAADIVAEIRPLTAKENRLSIDITALLLRE